MPEAQTPNTAKQTASLASPTASAASVRDAVVVHGLEVTPLTQCSHWHSDRDIIAIRHKCCGRYYACISCHEALAQHEPAVWPRSERNAKAIVCGNCRGELSIDEYLSCNSTCPTCKAAFNPGCANHYDLYFEMEVMMGTTTTITDPIHLTSLINLMNPIGLIPRRRLMTLPMGQGLVFLPCRSPKAMGRWIRGMKPLEAAPAALELEQGVSLE
ncbi:unnamed protein product [Clonostachys rosea]|uniref:CHY-type domain-containing protein n=1 Tax=Bionectria ochroleuca TaxID=29856 RepID=A0ABY6V2U7_BIOOC|nr:unnamed protein product [Clonostachys rosea]